MGKPRFELPATFEMVVWFTDGKIVGKATIDLPPGTYPSVETINKLVQVAEKQLEDSGLHICGPHEFGRELIMEKYGQRMATPGPNEWAAPYTSERGRT